MTQRRDEGGDGFFDELIIRNSGYLLMGFVCSDDHVVNSFTILIIDQLEVGKRLVHRVEDRLKLALAPFKRLGYCNAFTDVIVGTDHQDRLSFGRMNNDLPSGSE